MRRFRIPLIVAGVLIGLGLAGGGIAFWATGGATEAADHFLQTIVHQGAAAAYAETSPTFRAGMTEDAFAALSQASGLAQYRGATWSSRSIEGGKATLAGTLDIGGGQAPATMVLTKDDTGAWRVVSLSIERGGARQTGAAASPVPPAAPTGPEAQTLAQTSLMRLIEAIHSRDFRALQLAIAPAVRDQITPQQMAEHFKPFTDMNLDLTKDETTPVTLTHGPAVDPQGELTVKGYLRTPQRPWFFGFGYIQDGGAWQLVSLELSTKPIQ